MMIFFKKHIVFIISLIIFVCGIVLGLIGLYNMNNVEKLQYPQIALDEYVEKSETSVSSNEDKDEVTITIKEKVTVNVSDDLVELYYDNPSSNVANSRISLVIDDEIIATSGLIKPGYSLYEMHNINSENLEYGQCTGSLVIDTFNPETGERSIMNNNVEVVVQVNP